MTGRTIVYRMKRWSTLAAGAFLASSMAVLAQEKPTPAPPATGEAHQLSVQDAARHVGEWQWVCGEVVATRYDRTSIGMPTFLQMGHPATPAFTIVIWDKDRGKFPWPPEQRYQKKDVCAGGTIVNDKGKAQIVATSPKQIKEQPPKPKGGDR
jgi:hypothetical protein